MTNLTEENVEIKGQLASQQSYADETTPDAARSNESDLSYEDKFM